MRPLRNLETALVTCSPYALSVFRCALGVLLVLHATQKLFAWPVGPAASFGTFPAWWAGLIQLIAGALIVIGLVTRFAAFVASAQLTFAYVTVYHPNGPWPMLNGGELTLVCAAVLLLLVFTGGGTWSVDELRARG